jgi:hypothetical protein
MSPHRWVYDLRVSAKRAFRWIEFRRIVDWWDERRAVAARRGNPPRAPAHAIVGVMPPRGDDSGEAGVGAKLPPPPGGKTAGAQAPIEKASAPY